MRWHKRSPVKRENEDFVSGGATGVLMTQGMNVAVSACSADVSWFIIIRTMMLRADSCCCDVENDMLKKLDR